MFHKHLFHYNWWPKNSEKPQFWSIFVHYCHIYGIIDLLYGTKYGLFCFNCLNYVILSWFLTKVFHKKLFDYIWWPKYSGKPQFWHIFAYFCPFCGLIDTLYGTKYELFCFNCLNYIILLWFLAKMFHKILFDNIWGPKNS